MSGKTHTQQTYDLSLLEKSREKWLQSKGLRLYYGSLFEEMQRFMVPGPALELGSGIGQIKAFIPEVKTSEITPTPYAEFVCSAYSIPLAGESVDGLWSNILGLDVLHHLCNPLDFFESASRVLKPGGRIVLQDPAATPFGKVFYLLFHNEPTKPAAIRPPFRSKPDEDTGEFANMGTGIALFKHHLDPFRSHLHAFDLELLEVRFRDILAYPATGGFSHRQLLPTSFLKGLLYFESRLPQFILRCLGLRMVIVLRKLSQNRLSQ